MKSEGLKMLLDMQAGVYTDLIVYSHFRALSQHHTSDVSLRCVWAAACLQVCMHTVCIGTKLL